ncbi:aminoglycoside phosphotransferase family protein [Marihabitans asiaticum]|uniref:Streptomycin 6-kinase n=1 Tax=Marihabitans asiaticum TaxID=415218 RepID=A0A560WA74_9MICO|nr:aminoglycoside phosphotransferase family protein [Marihabitans asiaticum]TWD14395.1 streptomycin 6-kinase [Marihabitans asiaticum]
MGDLVPTDFDRQIRALPAEGGPSGAEWADRLPRLLRELLGEWGLVPSGPTRHGRYAVVVPVTGEDLPARGAALKIGWPHHESATEHLALRHWGGAGAVTLLRADPARGALLLERLTDEDLTQAWDEQACEIVGGLFGQLHVTPFAQAPRLSSWARRQAEVIGDAALPPRMASRAGSLVRDLISDPSCDATLLHGDLHYENVLSDGTDWVAIDPKPMAGHPAFEIAPMLWNRAEEMGTGSSFRYLVRRRAEILCEVGEISWEAMRGWTVVREVVNAMWATRDDDAARVSLAVTIIKALDD